MRRRDLIATILSLLPVAGVQSMLATLEAAVTGESDGSDDAAESGDDTAESGDDADDPPTHTRTAVVDRIEDDTAVVLFEDEGTQETVEAAVLPEAAREAGTVLRVPEGDSLALATVDRAATARRRQDAQDRFDELAERPPDPNESTNGSTDDSGD